jgi:ABC-type transport system involved in multi-copper enzyme maturation permease subunit
MNPEDREAFNAAEMGSIGAFFGLIVLVVFGVMTVSSEYTSGMIRLTMTATPRRVPVLAAKALLVAAGTLAMGFVLSLGSFFIAQIVLASYQGIDTASLTEEAALRSVLGGWLTMPVFPLLGAAAAVVMRSTAVTITGIMGLIFVPSIFGPLLPESVQEIGKIFPNFAIDSVSTVADDEDSPARLAVLPAIGVLLGWLGVFYFAAYVSLMRRDV